MLKSPGGEKAGEIREFLRGAGYTAEELTRRFHNTDPPIPGTPRWFRIEAETESDSLSDALVRWFFLGTLPAVPEAVPTELRSSFMDFGVLDDSGRPTVQWVPFGSDWIVSDRWVDKSDPDPNFPEDPVIGVGPAAVHLHRFTTRESAATVLDLGCGGGVQTLDLLDTANRVVASDLSRRALDFARFNLAFNRPDDVERVEFLCGDGLAPVEDRTFPKIICNPPFILTPSAPVSVASEELLDGLCRRFIRDGAQRLDEGGVLQMILEWVEIEGTSWQDRIATWLKDLSCDAWLLHANHQAPISYVETRVRELDPLGAEDDLGSRFRNWVQYFRSNQVSAIHGGLLWLRKRTPGRNWIRFEDLEGEMAGPSSTEVLDLLRRFDLLDPGHSANPSSDLADPWNERVLELPLRVAQPIRRQTGETIGGDGARSAFVRLDIGSGFRRTVTVDPEIAEFLMRFDGSQPARDVIDGFVRHAGGPEAEIRKEVGRVSRLLFEKGFLTDA